jgi:hypothetical protein
VGFLADVFNCGKCKPVTLGTQRLLRRSRTAESRTRSNTQTDPRLLAKAFSDQRSTPRSTKSRGAVQEIFSNRCKGKNEDDGYAARRLYSPGRCPMKRLFFDVANAAYVLYDYHGREFEKLEAARELAELIALDLECSDANNSAGLEVQVRDVRGAQLFSIPVREPELIAA